MRRLYVLPLPFIIILALAVIMAAAATALARAPLNVFVSILPQKYFVERIGGKDVRVSVMVPPGGNPATYEPTPRQIASLSRAQVYFRIGVPFEAGWIHKIQSLNPALLVVDTRTGIKLRPIDRYHRGEDEKGQTESGEVHPKEELDPHIWLSPRLVKCQAETILKTLSSLNPGRKSVYQKNFELFCSDLEQVDREIRQALENLPTRKFMVFHPSWGYFADEYDLIQIPIEVEGKEPSPRELARIIEVARREKIKVIFIQSQFSIRSAETVARAIGGHVVPIDPLAEDYLANLRVIASTLATELRLQR